MNKAKRNVIIAGNWKMNKTPAQAKALIEELIPAVSGLEGCKIVVCVPYVDIPTVVDAVKGTNISVGAQNVHFKESGAYTGEISAEMLTELGVEYVIIGHSERRQYFGETDVTVNLRTKAALAAGLKVILCVGEMLDERERGITEELIALQLAADLSGISAEDMKNIVIAYEPVWAIGTGVVATNEQAEEVCAFIRSYLAKRYGQECADAVVVQYGGSMNAANCAGLLACENIDGGLIGGASLKPADFAVIVKAAQ